jgi:hypothetical protein
MHVATLLARKKMNVSATGARIGRLYRRSIDNMPVYGYEYIVDGVQRQLPGWDEVELDDLDPWSEQDEWLLHEESERAKRGVHGHYWAVTQRALRIFNLEQDFLVQKEGSYAGSWNPTITYRYPAYSDRWEEKAA